MMPIHTCNTLVSSACAGVAVGRNPPLSLLIDIRSRGRSRAPKQSKDACRQSADLRLNAQADALRANAEVKLAG